VGTINEVIGLGMVGNAQWRGPRLCELLPALFPEVQALVAKGDATGLDGIFVQFEGADGCVALRCVCVCVCVCVCYVLAHALAIACRRQRF
jgi:hypothetical protein